MIRLYQIAIIKYYFTQKNERLVFDSRKEIGTTPKLNGFNHQDGNGKYKLVPVDGPGGAKKRKSIL